MSLQHPIQRRDPAILQVDETGAASEATQLGRVAEIRARSGRLALAPALLLVKCFSQARLQAPSRPGYPYSSPQGKGWEGFLHQLLTEPASLHSREHRHRTEFQPHMGSSQGPNSKYPATWAQVSEANLTGTASSVHSGKEARAVPTSSKTQYHTTRAGGLG